MCSGLKNKKHTNLWGRICSDRTQSSVPIKEDKHLNDPQKICEKFLYLYKNKGRTFWEVCDY